MFIELQNRKNPTRAKILHGEFIKHLELFDVRTIEG